MQYLGRYYIIFVGKCWIAFVYKEHSKKMHMIRVFLFFFVLLMDDIIYIFKEIFITPRASKAIPSG